MAPSMKRVYDKPKLTRLGDAAEWFEMLIKILAQYQPVEREAIFRYYTGNQEALGIEREFNLASGTLQTLRGGVRRAFFESLGDKS